MENKELIKKLELNPYASFNGKRYCQVSSEVIQEIIKRLEEYDELKKYQEYQYKTRPTPKEWRHTRRQYYGD